MRALDDYAAVRARMKELQRERREPDRTVRDWKHDLLGQRDSKLVEEVKKIIVRARFIRD
jgi:hypothetical protein